MQYDTQGAQLGNADRLTQVEKMLVDFVEWVKANESKSKKFEFWKEITDGTPRCILREV
jgi:hypothetical protein